MSKIKAIQISYNGFPSMLQVFFTFSKINVKYNAESNLNIS